MYCYSFVLSHYEGRRNPRELGDVVKLEIKVLTRRLGWESETSEKWETLRKGGTRRIFLVAADVTSEMSLQKTMTLFLDVGN